MHARKLLVAGLALAGAAQATELTIYTQPNFAGNHKTFTGDTATLQGSGVFDQSKSIVVRSGRWMVCSQPNYQGDCQVLERGQYASLPQQLSGRIESVREMSQIADAERYSRWRWEGERWREREDRRAERWDEQRRNDGNAPGGRFTQEGRGALVLYADGNATRYNGDVDDLFRTPFREGAERLVIRAGRWELCARPDYRGTCRVYEPGVYTNLGRFGTQIGSLRRVG